jgi:AraC-like DNA-binding protein/ligand-binding sensor protein
MMSPEASERLLALPSVESYQAAFRGATGVSLKAVPPRGSGAGSRLGFAQNGFCALLAGAPGGCGPCGEAEACAHQSAARKLLPQQLNCFAGLTVSAMPVLAGGCHVATLLGGQVFRREPTERDFLLVMKMAGRERDGRWQEQARRAYFQTPVLPVDRFQAVMHMMELFAHFLGSVAGKQLIATSASEPHPVAKAKEYVQAHAEEPITHAQVVQHVHMSRFYFCKLFKKATGMTLTEYVARVRVEKAKALLADPTLRISEVVFAAGFGSIPQFNLVFKRHVGKAPTDYRAELRTAPPFS